MYQDELDYRKLAVIKEIKVWQQNFVNIQGPQL